MKNYLHHTLALSALTVAFLLVFSVVNTALHHPFGLKKIDLLADIRPTKKNPPVIVKPDTMITLQTDSVRQEPLIIEASKVSGVTYLEDYSPDRKMLRHFHEALRRSKVEHVRVAFFGDSFIEGDILCGSFRDTLQNLFGGQGVGYVPMASEVAQFRMSIRHTYHAWETLSLVNKRKDAPLGFAGYCFIPKEGNNVSYQIPKKSSRPFETFRLFYQNHSAKDLKYIVNDTAQYRQALIVSDSLEELTLPVHEATSVLLHFVKHDSLEVYGGSFEGGPGVYVDNLAMRGNSGMGLSLISDQYITQFNDYQNYQLILLQYGLNVVHEKDSLGYDWYAEKMIRVVNKLKQALPEVAIVIVGVSDRGSNQDGTIATIPAIPRMRDAQRKIAQRTQVAFWDTYTAMGGSGTMVNYVNANPPLAAKDYTHLTYLGGRKIAKKLADALLHSLKKNETASAH